MQVKGVMTAHFSHKTIIHIYSFFFSHARVLSAAGAAKEKKAPKNKNKPRQGFKQLYIIHQALFDWLGCIE